MSLLDIFVDADGCPVKEEVYRVAQRYGLKVFLVANSWMRTPVGEWLEQITVGPEFNAADDWIAEHAGTDDIVITGDIPLASRCVHKGAKVLGLKGRPFTEENIGGVLATRDLLAELREQGAKTRGPDPFAKKDRSLFLQQLDGMIQEIRRRT
ncbi:MAG TPA: YaiI/YqxD family protein [Candidatus Krumholzibacteria bacterium]|nr:YaiI/YqxD family protein [Candidatus Krumholzibacteria bacterium]